MGAHAGGEEASRIAVTRIPEIYSELKPEHSPPLALSQSLLSSQQRNPLKGENDPNYKGMGTTCSTLVVLPQEPLSAMLVTVVFTECADITSNSSHEIIHSPGKLQQQAGKATRPKEPISQPSRKISLLAQWVLTAI